MQNGTVWLFTIYNTLCYILFDATSISTSNAHAYLQIHNIHNVQCITFFFFDCMRYSLILFSVYSMFVNPQVSTWTKTHKVIFSSDSFFARFFYTNKIVLFDQKILLSYFIDKIQAARWYFCSLHSILDWNSRWKIEKHLYDDGDLHCYFRDSTYKTMRMHYTQNPNLLTISTIYSWRVFVTRECDCERAFVSIMYVTFAKRVIAQRKVPQSTHRDASHSIFHMVQV